MGTAILSTGGGKRDRTADLLHAMQALSQLSYTPDERARIRSGRYVAATASTATTTASTAPSVKPRTGTGRAITDTSGPPYHAGPADAQKRGLTVANKSEGASAA